MEECALKSVKTERSVENNCNLSHNPIIWHYGQVGSCLDVAFNLAKMGNLNIFDSVICQSQTHGRGQLRRNWVSPIGNIYATIRLPNLKPFSCDFAAPAVGALIVKSFNDLGVKLKIKWPNDLVVEIEQELYKVGGILIEEREQIILAGIGINYQNYPDVACLRTNYELLATSLATVDCQLVKHNAPAKFWQKLVVRLLANFTAAKDFWQIWPEWFNTYLVMVGRLVQIDHNGEINRGILQRILANGSLLLESTTQSGVCFEVSNGSLSVVKGT